MMTARNYSQPEYAQTYGRQMQHNSLDTSRRYIPTSDAFNEVDSYSNSGYGRSPVDPYYPSASTSLTYTSTAVTSSYSPPSLASDQAYGQINYVSSSSTGSSTQGYPFSSQPILSRDMPRRRSPDSMELDYASSLPADPSLYNPNRASLNSNNSRPLRRPSNRDEFDGVNQYLPPLNPAYVAAQERDIPHLPTNLVVQEQDEILSMVTTRLSRCAYDFVAKYEFPIPVDPKLRPVTRPEDREWTEWVYLLKRLATKRRIPARLLYQGQIKQLVTVLENSLEMRCVVRTGSRPLRDDRNVLQLISAGIQVAKILKDAPAVEDLDGLYVETDDKILSRVSRSKRGYR